MSGVQFVFALFQLTFLFCHLLLEDHLHFGFHLGKLLLVESPLLLLLDGRVDLFEDAWVLGNTHLGQLLRAVVLIEAVVSVLLELFHVGTDQHLAQLDKVAMLLVVDLNGTPGVATATDLTTVGGCDFRVGTNNGKGDLRHDLLVLSDGLFVVELVAGALEDLDRVVLDIGEDLLGLAEKNKYRKKGTYSLLEQSNLLVRKSIGLGNDGNQVDLGVQPAHDLNVQRLQGVARRLDEVDARVDTVVNDVGAVDLVLGLEVGVVSLLNVLDNRAPRVIVVHKVTKSRGVDDGETKTDTVLLDIGADGLDGHSLGDDVVARGSALLRGVERGVEQCVDESRLSETRFT